MKVIIKKSISDFFYVYLEGHAVNKVFKQVAAGRFNDYKDAFKAAEIVATTANMISSKGSWATKSPAMVYINDYAKDDMVKYHDYMGLTPIEVIND